MKTYRSKSLEDLTRIFAMLKPYSDVDMDIKVGEHRTQRTIEQNAKMWAMLHDVSSQVEWYGERLTDEEWKIIFTAGLKKQRAVPGIDGGFVALGAQTSKMTIKEMSELIELIYAFGAEREVRWADEDD